MYRLPPQQVARLRQVVREALGDGRAEGSAGGYADSTCGAAVQ